YGWRVAMVIAAAPAVLLLPALLSLHEPERGAAETHREVVAARSMWSLLKIPTLLLIIASGALVNFNMYAIGAFLPPMFCPIYHVNVGQAGIQTGYVYMIGGLMGGLSAGWVADRIIRTRQNGRMLVGAVFTLIGAPFAYFGTIANDLTIAVVCWTVAYASLNT